MNFEVEEVVRQYQITIPVERGLVKLSARIIKHRDTEHYSYVTSQLFKEVGAADYYSPGAGASSIEQTEDKMFEYLKKFEEAVCNGALTTGNILFW